MASVAAARREPDTLSGGQKCAVLCMVLGTEQSAKVMQLLTPTEVEDLTREIASLPLGQGRGRGRRAAGVSRVRPRGAVGGAGRGGLRAAGARAGGGGLARQGRFSTGSRSRSPRRGLKRLKKAQPDVLLSVLRGEHPQTLALILAHLEVGQAAGVIEVMERELAGEVLFRVARMEKVSPEMLALVEAGLEQQGRPLAVARR